MVIAARTFTGLMGWKTDKDFQRAKQAATMTSPSITPEGLKLRRHEPFTSGSLPIYINLTSNIE
jgi:hypothetical protein